MKYLFYLLNNMFIDEILQEEIVERKIYLEKLYNYVNSPIIKVITGIRRVWKSYILKSLIQKLVKWNIIKSENIFYINKEDIRWDYIDNYIILNNEFEKFSKDKVWKIWIFLDEIQEIDWWEKFVRSLLLKPQKYEIFITGSNSEILSSELSTFISGRYVEIQIFPLSLKEYSTFAKKTISKDLFFEYIKYGWLPGIFYMNKKDEIIFNYLKWVYNTILVKDIVKHFWLRNVDFFEKLYVYLLANIWNIFSAKKISDYLKTQKVKISPETILNYITYWKKSYILYELKAVLPQTKKYFEIYNKYYVQDLGLRNAIVWFDLSKNIWKLLENYVFLEIKRKWYDVYLWRLKDKTEIDFIIEKQWIRKYIQVCYSLNSEQVINREYGSLEKIKDSWEKYVVSLDDINFGIRNGIKHINIMDLENIL